jgi:glycerol-3-phosphate dehydrogenase
MYQSVDLIVIGGGATGAGIALDAALRGLSVTLFEQNDFGEGTSSRSTKLVHGGVRYLEAAVKHLDKDQWKLVREGLKERKRFLHNASHLAHSIELITPIYKWREMAYVYFGLVLYDLISGKHRLGTSHILGAKETLNRSNVINPIGLKGSVSYFDGTFNDARMVIALLQSAEKLGANVYNHHEITQILKNSNGKAVGVKVYDKLNDSNTQYLATAVINATGPFADNIRSMDDPDCKPLIKISSGIHIVLPARFLPESQGVMIPKTSDGRLLFALPYGKHCMVGTTDNPATLSEHPRATEDEIDFLLEHYNRYFATKANRDDILSIFSGLRPLMVSDKHNATSALVRESEYVFSPSGMLTVTGGKWTAYRAMGEKALDLILARHPSLSHAKRCETSKYKITGSTMPRNKIMEKLNSNPLLRPIAEHLYELYGDQSIFVADYAENDDDLIPIASDILTTRAEIRYAIYREYALKPLDFIVRRSGIGLADRKKSFDILPEVIAIMRKELHWSDKFTNSVTDEVKKGKILYQ